MPIQRAIPRWLGLVTIAALPFANGIGAFAQKATRVAGVVLSAVGGSPLSRARVSLIEVAHPSNRLSLVTADDGRFAFTQVHPGKFSLQGAKRGFIPASYDEHEQYSTAIVTGAGLDTEHLMLRLSPAAVLAGKVLDETGDPVRTALVTLYREEHSTGVSRVLRWRNEATDDQGFYEFADLEPGTYFLSAAATPWYAVHPSPVTPQENSAAPSQVDPSLDVAYAPTYYQDAAEPDDALPIPLKGGDNSEVTIHMNPVPSLHLRFRSANNGDLGFVLPTLERPSLDGMDFVQTNGAQMISPGLWEISGVAAGRYSVQIPSQDFGAGIGSHMEATITSDGEELDLGKGEAAGSINATVALPANATSYPRLTITLLDQKMRVTSVQEVNDKHEVEFQNIPPGNYEFRAVSPAKAFSVTEIYSAGHKSSGHTFTLSSGASAILGLTLKEGAADVEGFAKRGEKAFAGAMVLLVPEHPESNRELFRRDQSDLDGSFVLRSVIPGSYTIVAIEDGWDIDWSSPGVIGYYLRSGQPVTVDIAQQAAKHLAIPVQVQSK